MPQVISLKGGKVSTLFSERDFEYLIDEHMGYDAKEYFRKLLEDKDETISDLKEEIKDMTASIRGLENKISRLESDFNHDE